MKRKYRVGIALFTLGYMIGALPLAAAAQQNPQVQPKWTAAAIAIRQATTNHVMVPVSIGGKLFHFVLDTGAGMNIISSATRAAIADSITSSQSRPMASITSDGQNSQPQVKTGRNRESVVISSIQVGGHEVKGLKAGVMDLQGFQESAGEPFSGILGLPFIYKFHLKLDLAKKALYLQPRDEPYDARAAGIDSMIKIPFRIGYSGRMIVEGRVDDVPVKGIFDTGARATILNWRVANAAGVTKETPGLAQAPKPLRDIYGNVVPFHTYDFKQIDLGGLTLTRPNLAIAEISALSMAEAVDKQTVLFGVDLLKGRTLFITFASGRQGDIYISQAASPTSQAAPAY